MRLTILGCHSATPRINAHPTSQVLHIKNHHFLIDCGEGTQMQLRRYKVGFSKIKHIFISHLHGDHFFGLIGLISTFRLMTRESELHIYAPKDAEEVIKLQLKTSKCWINFPLIFHHLTSEKSELIFEDEKIEVHTIPLDHRVYTNGFLFKEKLGLRKININAVKKYPEIDICDYQNLKNGKDYILKNGSVIKNEEVTFPPPPPKSYAFCSDTAYKPDIVPIIKNVTCLYHESTFLNDKKELAQPTKHATAQQAAFIAQQAEVNQLILGHFSARYKNKNLFLEEASPFFNNTFLAEEGKTFVI